MINDNKQALTKVEPSTPTLSTNQNQIDSLLSDVINENNPNIQMEKLSLLLKKDPNPIKRLLSGSQNPNLQKFQNQNVELRIKQMKEFNTLVHKFKVSAFKEQCDFYLKSQAMYNITVLTQVIDEAVSRVEQTIANSEKRFNEMLDKEYDEIETKYNNKFVKERAEKQLMKRAMLHEETMDKLLEEARNKLTTKFI
ncbi:MAG: hypothetical protein KGV51_08595 [Moraxellaceae bacterium]|nr:hypothetical protein [Moraxellaceae bacterium]